MEGLQNLIHLLQERDYMCKFDVKVHIIAFFYRKSQGNTFGSADQESYTNLCFGLGPAPRIFTKLLKIPIAILRRINIRMIIYLDDMLLMGHSTEEISTYCNTVMFLLQHLGFVDNWKKSILTPVQEIEYVGLKINSVSLDISHRRENTEGKNKMSKFTDRTRNIDFRISTSDWFVGINNPSSTASKITMSVSSAAANIIFKRKPFILARNSSELPIKNRITMVDKKPRSLQWLIINSAFCAGSHKNRYLNKGLRAT